MVREIDSSQQLTIGDRINYPYILSKAIISWLESIVKQEGSYSEQEVKEAARGFKTLILDSWIKSDPKYQNEIKKATKTIIVDLRSTWCGRKVGKLEEHQKIIKISDPYKIVSAAINLLDRQGYIEKKVFTEIKLGIREEDLEEERSIKNSEKILRIRQN